MEEPWALSQPRGTLPENSAVDELGASKSAHMSGIPRSPEQSTIAVCREDLGAQSQVSSYLTAS